MTTEALTAIKAALARVRPNEWFAQGDRYEVRVSSSYLPGQELIALCSTGEGAGTRSAYIAACNPSAISSLISSYEAMERRVARMENALKLGDQLANSCFNLSQSGSVGARQQATLKGLSQQWDAARREVRALPPSGEEQ